MLNKSNNPNILTYATDMYSLLSYMVNHCFNYAFKDENGNIIEARKIVALIEGKEY